MEQQGVPIPGGPRVSDLVPRFSLPYRGGFPSFVESAICVATKRIVPCRRLESLLDHEATGEGKTVSGALPVARSGLDSMQVWSQVFAKASEGRTSSNPGLRVIAST